MSFAAQPSILTGFGLVAGVLSVVGSLYTLVAAALVSRLPRKGRGTLAAAAPGVTVLKPLHGAETGLLERLLGICDQHYDGPLQIVLGCQDPHDPALEVVAELKRLRPAADIDLVVGRRVAGSNRKVANLVAMAERARHEVVVAADSDIGAGPDYVARLVACLSEPGVGAVTCLYTGLSQGGLGSSLASLAINAQFLPNAVAGMALAGATPCFGSTIALERTMLDAIGGFTAFVDQLADDYAIGHAVRATGSRVAVAEFAVSHACCEPTFASFLRHQLRVVRTIRSVDPLGHAGSVVTHPLPLALLSLPVGGLLPLPLIALAMVVRLVLCRVVERRFDLDPQPLRLLPLLDVASFILFLASFAGSTVSWRGHGYRVMRDGTFFQKGA